MHTYLGVRPSKHSGELQLTQMCFFHRNKQIQTVKDESSNLSFSFSIARYDFSIGRYDLVHTRNKELQPLPEKTGHNLVDGEAARLQYG